MLALNALGNGQGGVYIGSAMVFSQNACFSQLGGDGAVFFAFDDRNDRAFTLAGAIAAHDQRARRQPGAGENNDQQGNAVRK